MRPPATPRIRWKRHDLRRFGAAAGRARPRPARSGSLPPIRKSRDGLDEAAQGWIAAVRVQGGCRRGAARAGRRRRDRRRGPWPGRWRRPFVCGRARRASCRPATGISKSPRRPICAWRASAFLIGAYRFGAIASRTADSRVLVLDKSLDVDEIAALAEAVWLARDLVNTPANDLGPDGIEAAARRSPRRAR
jgi:hypothetical protein